MRLKLIHLLTIGLAVAFLHSVISIYLDPGTITNLVSSSPVFKNILNLIPFFPMLILINDLLLALSLLSGIWRKWVSLWAALWLGVVLIVHFSTFSQDQIVDGIGHITLLLLALYIFFHKEQPTTQPSSPNAVSPTPTLPNPAPTMPNPQPISQNF